MIALPLPSPTPPLELPVPLTHCSLGFCFPLPPPHPTPFFPLPGLALLENKFPAGFCALDGDSSVLCLWVRAQICRLNNPWSFSISSAPTRLSNSFSPPGVKVLGFVYLLHEVLIFRTFCWIDDVCHDDQFELRISLILSCFPSRGDVCLISCNTDV